MLRSAFKSSAATNLKAALDANKARLSNVLINALQGFEKERAKAKARVKSISGTISIQAL